MDFGEEKILMLNESGRDIGIKYVYPELQLLLCYNILNTSLSWMFLEQISLLILNEVSGSESKAPICIHKISHKV